MVEERLARKSWAWVLVGDLNVLNAARWPFRAGPLSGISYRVASLGEQGPAGRYYRSWMGFGWQHGALVWAHGGGETFALLATRASRLGQKLQVVAWPPGFFRLESAALAPTFPEQARS